MFHRVKSVTNAGEIVIDNLAFKLPSHTTRKRNQGYFSHILVKSVEQINAMLSYHNKVLIFRLDFHLNEPTEKSELVSSFIRRLRSWFKRQGYKRLGYIWCREQGNSDKPHYHMAFIVDANKCRNPYRLIKQVEHYWQDWQYGFVYTPRNCYYVLKRNDEVQYQKVFSRISYLAKTKTKGTKLLSANDYSASRIKSKYMLKT